MQKDRQSYAPYYSGSGWGSVLRYDLSWGGFSPQGLLALELSALKFFFIFAEQVCA
jgi:hypothetical protein